MDLVLSLFSGVGALVSGGVMAASALLGFSSLYPPVFLETETMQPVEESVAATTTNEFLASQEFVLPPTFTTTNLTNVYNTYTTESAYNNERFVGLLSHTRWLIEQQSAHINLQDNRDFIRLEKQVFSAMDNFSEDIDDLGEELSESGDFTGANLIAPTFDGPIGSNLTLGGNWLTGDGDSEGISIDGQGNVGVGTSTPNSSLTVSGDADISGDLDIVGDISVGVFTAGSWQGDVIAAAYLDSAVVLETEIDTSAELAAILTDETGSGAAVFANSPTLSGTLNAAAATLSSTLTMSGTAANIVLGANYLSGDGGDEGIYIHGNGNVGVGTTTPPERVSVVGGAIYLANFAPASATNRLYANGGSLYWNGDIISGSTTTGNWDANGGDVYRLSGNVGIGTDTPTERLTVDGNGLFTGTLIAANVTGTTSGTNTGDITIAGENYLSLVNQVLTANAINLAGSNVTGILPIAGGGTGSSTAAGARFNLGLGTISTLDIVDISDNTNLAVGNGITLTGDTLTVTAAGGLAQTAGGLTTTGVLEDLNTLGAALSDGQFIVATGAGAFAYESGATARTSLGATTVGSNIFTLTDPSSVSLIRINADNTVTAVATSTLGLSSSFSTSAQLAALLSDETGSGAAVFANSPTLTGTLDAVAGDFSSTLTMSGTAANIALGSNFLSGDGGDEGIFVDGSGNVGIGTSSPISKFAIDYGLGGYISLGTSGSGGASVSVVSENISTPVMFITGNGTADLVRINDGVTNVFTVKDGGNIGIGTTTPATLLDVNGVARANGSLITYAVGVEGGQLILGWAGARPTGQSNRTWNVDVDANDAFRIFSQNAAGTTNTIVQIASSTGNIGIGTTTPGSKLTVIGTTNITGNTDIGGGLDVAGNITVTGLVDGKDIATNGAFLNEAETITANWVNTANPWADNEVADILTISGGTIGSNNISGTLTTTGALTIGDGGDNIVINSNTWDISGAGAISGLTGLTTSGTVTFSGLTANRLISTAAGGVATTTITLANVVNSISDVSGSTGTGNLVLSASPTFTGTAAFANSTNSGTLAVSGVTTLATTTINNLTLTQALAATSGGTGQSTYTTGDFLYSSATNVLSKRAIGTTGQILSVSGGLPTWTSTSTLGLSSSFSNSAQLAALLSDETGTGNAVFSVSPTITGTLTTGQLNVDGDLVFTGGVRDISGVGELSVGTIYASGSVYIPSGNLDVAGNITVTGLVDGKDIATNGAFLNEAETITANWVNTANPWADNEVADILTISGGTIGSNNISGTLTTTAALTIGDGGDNIVINSNTWDVSGAGVASGFTGITTTGTLDAVAGDFSSTLTMSGTAANIALGSNWLSGDGGDEGIFVDGSGNVGIGDNTPTGLFDVAGSIGSFRVDSSGARVQFTRNSNNYIQLSGGTSANLIIEKSAGGTIATFLETGNVGIGTTTPGSTLTVSGTTNITGNTDIGGGLDVAGNITVTGLVDGKDIATNAAMLNELETISGIWEVQDDVDFRFGNDANWSIQYDEAVDDQLLFVTTGTAAAAITDPMVEFLVGTTPTANQQVFGVAKGTQAANTALFTLDEDGDAIFAGSVDAAVQFLGQGADASTTPSFSWTGDTNTGMFRPAADTIAFSTGGAEEMRITSGGNVGIGTTTPGNKLTVQGDISWGGSTARGGLTNTSDTVFVDSSIAGNTLSLRTNNGGGAIDRLTVLANGNIGIGTTTPGSTLTVVGTTNITGNTDIGGGLDVAGNITVTGLVDGKDIATNGAFLNEAETITANWVNTTNPWADNEVADILTISGGTIGSNNISGTLTTTAALTIGDGGDTITVNSSNWDVSSAGVFSGGTWQGNDIASAYLDAAVILSTEIDTYAELNAIVADQTLATLGQTQTFTGVKDFTGSTVGAEYGINGRYTDVGGGSTFGATIWSLDTTWQGAAAGNGYGPGTNAYSLAWLRASNASSTAAAGEGIYIFAAGARRAAIGALGLTVGGSDQFTVSNVGAVDAVSLALSSTLTVTATTTLNGVLQMGSAPLAQVALGAGDIVGGDTTGGFHLDASGNDMYLQESSAGSGGPQFISRKSRGTASSPSSITSADDILHIRGYAANASSTFAEAARITFDSEGTISGTAVPGVIRFYTATAAGSITERLTINSAGTTTVTGNLAVTGTIDGKDVANNAAFLNEAETITANWVNTANPWADNEVADILTISGGTIGSNNISGTLTTTGALTIGDGGDNIVINSNTWDISGAGVASGLTGITTTGTLDAVAGDFSSTLTMSGTAANIALGSNFLSGDGGDEGIFVDGSGNVGIGTTTPSANLAVQDTTAELVVLANGTGSTNPVAATVRSSAIDNKVELISYESLFTASQDLGVNAQDLAVLTFENTTNAAIGTNNTAPLIVAINDTEVGRFTTTGLTALGTIDAVAGDFSSTLTMSGTAANIALGSNYLSGDGGDEGVYVDAAGDVGVGTTTPGSKLTVAGTIQATNLLGGATTLSTDANGNIIRTPSDKRLKEDISNVENAMDSIMQLQGVRYAWKDKQRFGEQYELGFLAQDVELVLPELVQKGGDYWTLNTPNMLAVVIEGMKEMWNKIQGHDERLSELEEENQELKERLNEIESELDIDTPAPAPEPSPEPEPDTSNEDSSENVPESDGVTEGENVSDSPEQDTANGDDENTPAPELEIVPDVEDVEDEPEPSPQEPEIP